MMSSHRPLVIWLAVIAGLLLAMVMLGGLTRLTESGLSITEWKPVTGVLPPLSEAAWEAEFAKYQRIPEYQLINKGMSLADFRAIYWWEWSHRLLGRLIGIVFFVPFVVFAVMKRIPRPLIPRLAAIFVLGGMQGALGWFMVKSGLSVRTDVSHYRLAAHLAMAFLILGAVLWTIFDLARPGPSAMSARARAIGWGFVGLVAVQIVLGAFVAGLDAGFVYNSWPAMDGRFLPREAADAPLGQWLDNAAAAQFLHRTLALLVMAGAFALWLDAKRTLAPDAVAVRRAGILVGIVGVQFMLGVLTLLARVPIGLAAAHQLGAAALFAAALYHVHGLTPVRSAVRQAAGIRSPGSGS